MVDTMFESVDDYDIDGNKEMYIRLLTICNESPKIFQYFSKITAKKMIEWKFPDQVQSFLKQFIFDIRLRKRNYAEFNRMYDDDLFFYVEILSELLYGSDDGDSQAAGSDVSHNQTVCGILKNLKLKDFQRFVILVTHFDQFLYLLNES